MSMRRNRFVALIVCMLMLCVTIAQASTHFIPSPYKFAKCSGFTDKCVVYTPDAYKIIRAVDEKAYWYEKVNFEMGAQMANLNTQVEELKQELIRLQLGIGSLVSELNQIRQDYKQLGVSYQKLVNEHWTFWDTFPWIVASFAVGAVAATAITLSVD